MISIDDFPVRTFVGLTQPACALEAPHDQDTMAAQAEKLDGLVESSRPAIVRPRIAATDSVSIGRLGPDVDRFLRANPGISTDLLASTGNVDFSRWKATLIRVLGTS